MPTSDWRPAQSQQQDDVTKDRTTEDDHNAPRNGMDFLFRENQRLATENRRIRQCLLLMKENCELHTLNYLSQAMAMNDARLRKFLTDAVVSTPIHDILQQRAPYYVSPRKEAFSLQQPWNTANFSPASTRNDRLVTDSSYGQSFPQLNASALQSSYGENSIDNSYGQSFQEIDTNELADNSYDNSMHIQAHDEPYGRWTEQKSYTYKNEDTRVSTPLHESSMKNTPKTKSIRTGTSPRPTSSSRERGAKPVRPKSPKSVNTPTMTKSTPQPNQSSGLYDSLEASPRSQGQAHARNPPMKFSLTPNPLRQDPYASKSSDDRSSVSRNTVPRSTQATPPNKQDATNRFVTGSKDQSSLSQTNRSLRMSDFGDTTHPSAFRKFTSDPGQHTNTAQEVKHASELTGRATYQNNIPVVSNEVSDDSRINDDSSPHVLVRFNTTVGQYDDHTKVEQLQFSDVYSIPIGSKTPSPARLERSIRKILTPDIGGQSLPGGQLENGPRSTLMTAGDRSKRAQTLPEQPPEFLRYTTDQSGQSILKTGGDRSRRAQPLPEQPPEIMRYMNDESGYHGGARDSVFLNDPELQFVDHSDYKTADFESGSLEVPENVDYLYNVTEVQGFKGDNGRDVMPDNHSNDASNMPNWIGSPIATSTVRARSPKQKAFWQEQQRNITPLDQILTNDGSSYETAVFSMDSTRPTTPSVDATLQQPTRPRPTTPPVYAPLQQPTRPRPTTPPVDAPLQQPTRARPTTPPVDSTLRQPTRARPTTPPVNAPLQQPTRSRPTTPPVDAPLQQPTRARPTTPTVDATLQQPTRPRPTTPPVYAPLQQPTRPRPTTPPVDAPLQQPTRARPTTPPVDSTLRQPTRARPTTPPVNAPLQQPTRSRPTTPPVDAPLQQPTRARPTTPTVDAPLQQPTMARPTTPSVDAPFQQPTRTRPMTPSVEAPRQQPTQATNRVAGIGNSSTISDIHETRPSTLQNSQLKQGRCASAPPFEYVDSRVDDTRDVTGVMSTRREVVQILQEDDDTDIISSLAYILGFAGRGAGEKVKSLVYRPVDALTGYTPRLTIETCRALQTTQPSRRMVGEIAFQLDRRVLEFVIAGYRNKLSSRLSFRYYGYSLTTIFQLIEKEAKNGGVLDSQQEYGYRRRFDFIVKKLQPLGYVFDLHAEFCQDMVNKYGLLDISSDASVVEKYGLQDLAMIRLKLFQLLHIRREQNHVAIILDCLSYLSYEDGRPIFIC